MSWKTVPKLCLKQLRKVNVMSSSIKHVILPRISLYSRRKLEKKEVKKRDGWRRDILQTPNGLKLSFDSMYAATKELAPDLQKVVKRILFSVVSYAEDAMENCSPLYSTLNLQASCTSASSSVYYVEIMVPASMHYSTTHHVQFASAMKDYMDCV
ncbi:hypothetical protein PR048_018728 [Dryococelus australis]|uniref:Uncharacterized protein n=1 Tax=Dryococelus australis TaxID=614101 RepID=A0ABQ9HD11_9NEOP|nr:hypothetical protein PR048_018728 [Dryococelus australis]